MECEVVGSNPHQNPSYDETLNPTLKPDPNLVTDTKLHETQKQTDQITAGSTAVELNSEYGIYEADLIDHSFNPGRDRHTIRWSKHEMRCETGFALP